MDQHIDSNEDSETPEKAPRVLKSEDLLQGDREVQIQHGDETYRLRQTLSGKLYLSK